MSDARCPILSSFRPRSKPGMPRSIASSEIPLWPAAGSVFTTVTTRSARMPLLMNVFAPLTT